MIKITKTTNSTITIEDDVELTKFIILGKDCEVFVFTHRPHIHDTGLKVRTLQIRNKYNKNALVTVDVKNLHTSSTNYSADMDTYANSLRDLVLYV